MRIYTAISSNNQPMMSVNAGSVAEARHVLTSILGDDGDLTVRRASESEAAAWLQTASSVERRRKMLRRVHKKSPTPIGDAGVSSTEVSLAV